MPSKQQQLALFDSSPYRQPARRGEMSMDKWVATQDPKFHGSFRSDFGSAPVAHYGTKGQAVTRLNSAQHTIEDDDSGRRRYYDPAASVDEPYDEHIDDLPSEPQTHVGQVFARRLEAVGRGKLNDAQANAAEMGYRYENHEEEWEIPHSIKESAGQIAPELVGWGGDNPKARHIDKKAAVGQRQLERGETVKYHNPFEGDNPIDAEAGTSRQQALTSFIAPSSNASSWERDVLNEPRAAEGAKRFAQQRIKQGKEGAVPFPEHGMTGQTTRQDRLPMFFDENERREGTAPNSENRWIDAGARRVPQQPFSKRRTVNNVTFTTT